MTNNDICEYIEKNIIKIDSLFKSKYLADKMVIEGYGQLCGGYLEKYENKTLRLTPSQREHFLNYYGDKAKKNELPTYYYLRCPQLILFISEIAGLKKNKIKNAFILLKNYEDINNLKGKNKNANYIWGKDIFKKFKNTLHFSEINQIIKKAKTWDEVIEKTQKL